MNLDDFNKSFQQPSGYPPPQRLYLEPESIEETDDATLIQMRPSRVGIDEEDSAVSDTIAQLVVERRSKLLELIERDVTVSEDQAGALIRIGDRGRFREKVCKLTAITARRLGSNEGEEANVHDLVARHIIKELWPALCLEQYAKDIKTSGNTILQEITRLSSRISQKTRLEIARKIDEAQGVLHYLKEPWKLSSGELLKWIGIAHKILNDNAILAQRLAKSQETVNLQTFKGELKKFLVEIGEEAPPDEQHSWLGTLVLQPLRAFTCWLLDGSINSSPVEREVKDAKFLQRFGDDIRQLGLQRQLFEDQESLAIVEQDVDHELCRLVKKLIDYEAIVSYLDDYTAVDDDAHGIGQGITDQTYSLERTDQCHFSAVPYVEMLQLMRRFTHMAGRHKVIATSERMCALIDRKISYQEKQLLEFLQELVEQLLPAMLTEFDEAKAHYVNSGTPENWLLLAHPVKSCEQFIEEITPFVDDRALPEAIINKIRSDLTALQSLKHQMEEGLRDLEEPEDPLSDEDLEEMRSGRPILTVGQARRIWEQQRLEESERPLSERQKTLLNLFFLWLQVGTPILGTFATPVGKKDYNYYLTMMAEAARNPEAVAEGYDYYFARAQAFWGTDDDFLRHYDMYLRGEEIISYSPHVQESVPVDGLLTKTPPTTETLYDWIKSIAPASIADWTAAFLGFNTGPQLSAWDHWVNSAILPQLRDNYFEQVTRYFDQLPDSAEAPSKAPISQFGFHCYKIYEALKDPSASNVAFSEHWKKAASFSQFSSFFHDYTTYLQTHPPEITIRTATVSMATPSAELLSASIIVPEHAHPHRPFQSADEQALRMNKVHDIDHLRAQQEVIARRLQELNTAKVSLEELAVKLSAYLDGEEVKAKTEGLANNIANGIQDLEETSRTLSILVEEPHAHESALYGTTESLWHSNACEIQKNQLELEILNRNTQGLDLLQQIIKEPPLAVDDKLLLSLFGDSFGLNSGLEGLPIQVPLQAIIALWKSKHALIEKNKTSFGRDELFTSLGIPHGAMGQQSEAVLLSQLERALTLYRKSGESVEEFARHLKWQLSSTKPGESVLLPGGWTNAFGSHAIYYEWTRQPDDRFSLRIYNTGEGKAYHPKATINFREQAITFIEQCDIPLQQIVRLPTLKALIEIDSSDPKGGRATDVYDTVVAAMGGRPLTAKYTSDDLRNPQHAGICSMMSLTTLLSYRQGSEQIHHHSLFELGLKALIDYEQSHSKRIIKGEDVCVHLLSKSLREFSRQLIEYQSHGVISDLEYIYAQQQVSRIHTTLQAGKTALQASQQAPLVTLVVPRDKSGQIVIAKAESFRPISHDISPISTQHYVIDIVNWIPKVETVQSDIAQFAEEITSAHQSGDYRGALSAMSALMERLPLEMVSSWRSTDSDQEKFWELLSRDDSLALIGSLTQIAKTAFESQFRLTSLESSKRKMLLPRHYLAQAKLQIICQTLAANGTVEEAMLAKAFIDGATSDLLLRDHSLFLRTYDPELDHTIQVLGSRLGSKSHDWKSEHWKVDSNLFKISKDHQVRPKGEWSNTESIALDEWVIQSHPLATSLLTPHIIDQWKRSFPAEKMKVNLIYAWASSDSFQYPVSGTYGRLQDRSQYPKRSLFPPLFYHLRDLMMLNHYLVRYPTELLPDGKVPEITYIAKAEIGSAKVWATVDAPNDWIEKASNLGRSFEEAHRTIRDSNLRSLLIGGDDKIIRKEQNKQLWEHTSILPGLSIERQRSIMGLLSKEELQVREVITFFINNARLLTQQDYQVIFNTLLFAPGRLLRELSEASHEDRKYIAKMATEFFSNQYTNYRRLGDLQLAAYFLHIDRLFRKYIDYGNSKLKLEIMPLSVAIDTKQEIRHMLAHEMPDEARALLNLQLALSYDATPPSQHSVVDVAEIIAAAIASRREIYDGKVLPTEQTLALDALLEDHRQRLSDLTTSFDCNTLLNMIMERVKGSPCQQQWKPYHTFPFFISEDGLYAIDVVRGRLEEKNGSMTRLKADTLSSHDFVRTFGLDFNPMVKRISSSFSEFTDHDGIHYRVEERAGNLPILQRLFSDAKPPRWYQLASPATDRSDLAGERALQFCLHWVSPSPNYDMLITKQGSSTPAYRATKSDRYPYNMTVHLLDSEESAILAKSSPNFFSIFEDDGWILPWTTPDGKLSLVELPRYHLEFRVEDSRIYCNQFPGYFLSPKQTLPALGAYSNFLLLENAKGKRKVIIPEQRLISREDKKGNLQTSKQMLERDLISRNQSYLEYDIDRSTGKLIPRNDAGRFHLAGLLLKYMDYGMVHEFLRGIGSSLRPFDKHEVHALSTILHSDNDMDPRALSARLYVYYLLRKNGADFPESSIDSVECPESLMKDYLNVVEHLGIFGLRPEEELFLLSQSAISIAAQHRLRYLTDEGTGSRQPLFHSDQYVLTPFIDRSSEALSLTNENIIGLLVGVKYPKSASGSILRPPIMAQFSAFYKLVRGELNDSQADQAYKDMTGISSLPKSSQDRRDEINLALNIMRKRVDAGSNALALLMLQLVLNHPQECPRWSEMTKLMEESKVERIRNLFEPLLNLNDIQTLPEPPNRSTAITLSPTEAAWPKDQTVDLPFQMCIAPYEPSVLSQPLVPNLHDYLTITPVPVQDRTEILHDLNALFSLSAHDRVLQKEFDRVKSDITSYAAEKVMASPPQHYAIANMEGINALRGELEQQITQGERSLSYKERSLLAFANRKHVVDVAQTTRELEGIGHDRPPIDINTLITLFLKRDMDGFHRANEALNIDEINDLDHEVMHYLIQSTHLQQLRRLSRKIADIQEAANKRVPAEEISQMLESLSTMALANRAYDVWEEPAYLVIEHYLNILLRSDQVKNLDLLRIEDGKIGNADKIGVVLESIPGSGKTEVLLPILAQLCANGDNLCIGILPEALLPDMAERLSRILGGGFKQSVEVLSFDRQQNFNADSLRTLLFRLNQAITQKRMLLMGSSSIQSLYLKLMESWRSYVLDPSIHNREEFDLLRSILRLFKEKGLAIIDEADLILYVRKELHFTLGAPQQLPEYEVESVCHLFNMLLDPNITPDMSFDFGSAVEGAPAFTPERYLEKMASHLVDKFLGQFLGCTNPEIVAFLQGMNTQQTEWVRSYLLGLKEAASLSFVEHISDMRIKDLLRLAREQIHTLLPLTANKILDVNYGASENSEVLVSIPYHGSNNPSEGSRYGPYETLNYTIQRLLKKGISNDVVLQEIEQLQADALLILAQRGVVETSSTYQRFLELTGGDTRIKLLEAHRWVDTIAMRINRDRTLRMNFIRRYAISQIQSHPLTLSANAQLFNFLFNHVIGFTGTLWNEQTFPPKLETIASNLATALSLELLWTNSYDKVHVLPVIAGESMMRQLILANDHFRETHAIIDAAGYGRGVANEKHAKALLDLFVTLKRSIPVNGVAFYNSKGDLMIWERDAEQPIPLFLSIIPAEERITFYDQPHTTGSNIDQAYNAMAIVTIGKHMILRDFIQAIWRMRGLERGQTIEFAIDEEVRDLILTTLRRVFGIEVANGDINLSHLLLFVTYNQAILQGDNNYRSLKQKMQGILLESLMNSLLAKDITAESLTGLFDGVSSLFMTETGTGAWKLLGRPPEEKGSEEVIADLVETTLNGQPFQTLTKNPTSAPYASPSLLKEKIETLANQTLPHLPTKLTTPHDTYGQESELEKQNENEMQKETLAAFVGEKDYYARSYYTRELLDRLSDSQREEYFSSEPSSENPYIPLSRALGEEAALLDFQEVFDKSIIATLNLIPPQESQGSHGKQPMPYHLFNFFQKNISDILIIQDENTSGLRFVLGDLDDGLDWTTSVNWLNRSSGRDTSSKEISPACVYRLNFGPYRSFRMDTDALQASPQFLKLMVQTKFFNGETSYSDEERPYLSAWIETHGVDKMRRLFNKITEWKAEAQKALPTSQLNEITKMQP